MFPEDRSLQLQNLVIVGRYSVCVKPITHSCITPATHLSYCLPASVNLAMSVVVVCMFIALWIQRGKGLKEHCEYVCVCVCVCVCAVCVLCMRWSAVSV